jgi:N-acetylglutamate synthase-like GNAT family acetyltransferase
MHIRKATINDARKINYLIQKTVIKVKENNYSSKQLEAFRLVYSVSNIRKNIMDRSIFCAFENNRLVGTIALNKDYIGGLYINYNKRYSGVGKKLLIFIENFATKNDIEKLYLISTPNGLGFYLKNGYKVIEKVNSFYNGIKFKETKMIKELNS